MSTRDLPDIYAQAQWLHAGLRARAYSTAQFKLDTHFGLLANVHRFCSSHSSKLTSYLCIALVVSLASDRI